VVILGTSVMHLAWIVVGMVFTSIPLGISCWALLDAAHRPSWAWAMTRHRQAAWIAAILFGVLILVGGLTISLWYLFKVRPAIAAVEAGNLRL